MQLTDSHVHVWTDDLERYPLAEGYCVADMQPPHFTPEELLAHCQASQVARVVLVQMSYYGFDNSYMLDTMARFPAIFRGIAVIDEDAPDAAEEMARLAALGVRGFRVQPQAGSLDRPGLRRMFAAAGETAQAMCCLMDTAALPSLDRLCRDYPATPVVIDHLCRIGLAGPITEQQLDGLCALAVHPRVKVKVSAFYALGQKRPPHDDLLPAIARLYETFGARRLMWGSDCPFQVQQETYEDGLAPLRDHVAFRSEEDREWVLGRTAEETFFS